jgi:hypothetical protein
MSSADHRLRGGYGVVLAITPLVDRPPHLSRSETPSVRSSRAPTHGEGA